MTLRGGGVRAMNFEPSFGLALEYISATVFLSRYDNHLSPWGDP